MSALLSAAVERTDFREQRDRRYPSFLGRRRVRWTDTRRGQKPTVEQVSVKNKIKTTLCSRPTESGVARNVNWGASFLSLSLSLPSFVLSSSPLFTSSLLFPVLPFLLSLLLEVGLFKIQVGGLEKAMNSSSEVWSGALTEIKFNAF